MNAARRVVVTGMGAISALGLDATEFWSSLSLGRSGIAPIEQVDAANLRFKNGAEVQGFEPTRYFSESQAHALDRFAQLGVIAAREAMANAGVIPLDGSNEVRERAAVITGSSVGGTASIDRGYHELYAEGRRKMRPLSLPMMMANAPAGAVAQEFGFGGPAFTVSSACASSNHALGLAFWMVRQGMADFAVAGGSEAPFSLGNLKIWEAIRAVSQDTCRPFSRDRSGLILGEGGAMMVLEPLEVARARGARIRAEVVGFGLSCDAHHPTRPLAEGQARALRAALNDANIPKDRIGYVNAHGTGTMANDATEAQALRSVFGDHTERLPVSSTKSVHGHTLGASGTLEGVATILALENGLLPPTVNFTELDPKFDIDIVANHARPADAEYALSSSFAFGGMNAVLAFRRWEGASSS